MGKRRPTAEGEYESGDGGFHGFFHRDHKPKHYQKKMWHRRHSETAIKASKRVAESRRNYARSLGTLFSRPNRTESPRRRP